MFEIFLRLTLFSLITGLQFCYGSPTVRLKQGLVQGTHGRSYDGRIYSAFDGIPYAKPPVGDLRFKEPIPAPGWNGTFVANSWYLCSQIGENQTVVGTEDCLYVYVYVPREHINKNDNFDVVVHIHGGFLSFGGPYTMALPDYLMDKDVIMVAINYRLGAAGFLSTGDKIVYGNNGLKDQSMALKWIKHNIKDFGGNPDSITITGFSAGSESVQYHYLSPLSRGLFRRGYSSSAVVTNSGALTLIPLQKAQQLAKIVKCPETPSQTMVDCLQKLPIEEIVEATKQVWFKPNIEKDNPKAFVTEHPYKMLKDKKVFDAPWVVSNTIDENMFTLDSVYKNRSEIFTIYSNWTGWCERYLDLLEVVDEKDREFTFNELKKFYIDDSEVTEENGLEKLSRLLTDRHFLVGTDLAIRAHSSAVRSPIYFYLFKFVPEDRLQFFGKPAASHGVDSKLLFKFRSNPDRLQPKGEKMMRLFVEFMTGYARTGIPKIGNVKWQPLNPRQKSINVLEINSPDDIRMITKKELAPMKLWDSLPIKENNHLY